MANKRGAHKVPESVRRKRERWDRADAENDREYWLAVSPQERLEALEYLRTKEYGYLDDESRRPRFVHVMRVIEMGGDDN